MCVSFIECIKRRKLRNQGFSQGNMSFDNSSFFTADREQSPTLNAWSQLHHSQQDDILSALHSLETDDLSCIGRLEGDECSPYDVHPTQQLDSNSHHSLKHFTVGDINATVNTFDKCFSSCNFCVYVSD